jgi:histidinol-phosphate aminotransferase
MNLESLIRPVVQKISPKVAGVAKSDRSIRLDKGEFPYPPSPQVIAAIQQAASGINRYPAVLTNNLRQVLADYNQVSLDKIFAGNGSDDLIELVLKICLEPGDEVILPIPTFFVYGAATEMLGGKAVAVPRTADFDLDLPAIVRAITDRTKLIFIANPNNPTANLTSREQIIALLEQVNCLVVIDECYFEICQMTVADLVDRYPHLIILRSLSKGFGLAGLRLGYGITNPQLVDYIYRVAQIFSVNQLAITAGIAAIQDWTYMQEKLTEIKAERAKLTKELSILGFRVYPSDTNFLFISSEPLNMTATAVVSKLASQEIYVADFANKPGLDAYHLRIATGTPIENERLLDTLR